MKVHTLFLISILLGVVFSGINMVGASSSPTVSITSYPSGWIYVTNGNSGTAQPTFSMTGSASGGTGVYTYQWFVGQYNSPSCSSNAQIPYSTNPETFSYDTNGQGNLPLYAVMPNQQSFNVYYCLRVTDSINQAAYSHPVVANCAYEGTNVQKVACQFSGGAANPVLYIQNPTVSPSVITLGNTIVLSDGGASGGTGGYTYHWLYEAPGSTTYNHIAIYTTSFEYAPQDVGTYNFEIVGLDSNGDQVVSQPVSVTVNPVPTTTTTTTQTTTPTTSPTTSPTTTGQTTTPTTTPTTTQTTTPTTTVQQFIGGGGPPPLVITNKTAPILAQVSSNAICYNVNNFTESAVQSFKLDQTNFSIINKYTFSRYADLIINNSYYTLNANETYKLSNYSGKGFFIRINNITPIKPVNYTTPVTVVSLSLCSYTKTPSNPVLVKPTTPVYLNLSIVNYTITAKSTQKNDTVTIAMNGKLISQGTGMAFVDASWLPAGKYRIQGKDINSGTFINQTLNKPLFKPSLKFTRICKNSTDSYNCTTSAQILSHNDVLSGKLYVNGKYVGSTNTVINYSTSTPGSYVFTFNTTGNAYYSNYSISYNFQNGSTQRNYSLPLFTVILVSCVVILLHRKRRISAMSTMTKLN